MTFFTFMIFVSVGNKHYVKSVQIRSFFWTMSSCIWAEYGKIETRKNSVFGNFSRSGKIKTIRNTKKGKKIKNGSYFYKSFPCLADNPNENDNCYTILVHCNPAIFISKGFHKGNPRNKWTKIHVPKKNHL